MPENFNQGMGNKEQIQEVKILIYLLTKETFDFELFTTKRPKFLGTFSKNKQELKGYLMKQE